MTSETEPLWPYIFLAVGWSAACAYMLLRERMGRKATMPTVVADSMPTRSSRSGQWGRDTQAGRM